MKAHERLVWWTIGLVAGIILGYAICLSQITPTVVHKNIISLETEREFRRKAFKHGQENTAHVWQEWFYTNEKGQKCKLGGDELR